MSYPNQYPQQPAYGQQQQYGQPQMPQGIAQPGYGAPPAGQYGAPPPAQYGAPQGQYGAPPAQGQYGAPPPPGQYGAPPAQGQYGAPPPAQYGAPQGHPAQPGYAPTYGAPAPAGQYGAPPPAQYGAPAPQGQYGAPQGYGGGGYAPVQVQLPRTYLGAFLHPSENPMLPQNEKAPSGQSVDGYNPSHDVEQIHKACKGFGTDEAKVTASIVPLSAAAMPPLIHAFKARHGTDLVKYLEKELGGNYEDVIVGIMRGPLGGDVHWLNKAMAGAGTNEKLVTELLISRPPSSLHLLRAAYQAATHRSFDQTVESELSYKTKQGFSVALMGDWKDSPGGDLAAGPAGGPVNEAMVKADVDQLKGAMRGIDDDEVLVASIVFARSPNHLNRLQALYLTTTRTPLTRKIKAHFTGHLQSALLYALEFAKKDTNGAWRDAKQIHKAMDGAGTDDKMLIIRILRAHWDRPRWKMVQQAYHHKYKVAMQTRVMKETSGDYRDGLLAILNLP